MPQVLINFKAHFARPYIIQYFTYTRAYLRIVQYVCTDDKMWCYVSSQGRLRQFLPTNCMLNYSTSNVAVILTLGWAPVNTCRIYIPALASRIRHIMYTATDSISVCGLISLNWSIVLSRGAKSRYNFVRVYACVYDLAYCHPSSSSDGHQTNGNRSSKRLESKRVIKKVFLRSLQWPLWSWSNHIYIRWHL